MANNAYINEVIYGTSTLINLKEDTVQANRMYKGITAHASDGSTTTGTAEITVEGTRLIMPEGLCTPIGTVNPDTGHWIRPSEWPDLTSVYNGEQNTLWMVVDATGRILDPHVSIKFWCTGDNYTIQVGSIQNGSFTVSETETKSSGAVWTKVWTPTAGNYPVVKITATTLRSFQLQSWTCSAGYQYHAQHQPIVYWIGDMEYGDNNTRTPYFTEYEKIKVRSSNNTFLRYRWEYAYYLQELIVSDWDTSNFPINSLSNTWYMCFNLKKLDLSNWDTSSWEVNSLGSTWHSCFSLKTLNISNLNTSSWVVTSIGATWYMCFDLEELDLRQWETGNWRVTSLNDTWNTCTKLKHLYINTWDTSEWVVASFNTTWNNCFVLEELDLSNWDTTKWTVTGTMNNTWCNCRKIKNLDLSNFNTSNWRPTNMTTTWGYCFELTELKIENWDVSNFRPTTLGYTWQNCYKLKELDLSKWDVSDWPINGTMGYTWNNCLALEKLDVSTWNTSNWVVTNLNSTWGNSRKLKCLNVSNWDTTEWKVTDLTGCFGGCCELERLDLSNWDTSNWVITTMRNCFNDCHHITEINISTWNMSNWPMTAIDSFGYPFRYQPFIKTVDLSWMDLSKIQAYRSGGTYNFDNCRNLENLTFGSNNSGKMNTAASLPLIRFDFCIMLTRQSLLNILDALADGVSGKTLQLGSINLAKLTAAEKAIATDKGWTLT